MKIQKRATTPAPLEISPLLISIDGGTYELQIVTPNCIEVRKQYTSRHYAVTHDALGAWCSCPARGDNCRHLQALRKVGLVAPGAEQ